MLHRKLTSENREKRGRFRTSPCPALCSALSLSSSRIAGPAVPAAHAGPRSDKMRLFERCVSCSRRRCGSRGNRERFGSAITALRNHSLSVAIHRHNPRSLPAVHEVSPLPRQDASDRWNAPGGGTLVREDRSSQGGLRPLLFPSTSNGPPRLSAPESYLSIASR